MAAIKAAAIRAVAGAATREADVPFERVTEGFDTADLKEAKALLEKLS